MKLAVVVGFMVASSNIEELIAAGTTIVVVSHLQYCAQFGNRIVRMLDGQRVTENVVRWFLYLYVPSFYRSLTTI